MFDADPLLLTLKLSTITTVALFVVGLPVAYWLAYTKAKVSIVVEALIALPLVLPPSVLGFYLLLGFSQQSTFGQWLAQAFDLRLVFTFPGLVIGSVIYSLPFMIQPLQNGFQQIPLSLREASYTLGKSEIATIRKVLLPNMKSSLITGGILAFAHTVGEFGVVLMIGGNIPKETRVASIAIYDAVEAMDYEKANMYSVVMLGFSFITLLIVYSINHLRRKRLQML